MEKKKMKKKKTMATSVARGGDLDLISELPDHILHHILSYLDMTCAIQTCFLSKRWRNIWSSLPFLNFDEKVYTEWFQDQEELFPIFVDQVLIFRNQKSDIQTFRVFHSNGDDYTILSHIYTWIHLLIRSNVKVIDLQVAMPPLDFPKLPNCLFTCESLTTLKLDMGGQNFDPPDYSVVCLPALKTLHLQSLELESSVEKLILKCPVLETLIVYDCCLYWGNELTICNAQLKRLVVFHNSNRYLKLNAPNLKSFSSVDDFHHINHYSFVNVPSLENAEVDIEFDPYECTASNCTECEWLERRKENDSVNVVECLRGIYNVKSLMLSAWLLELVPERCQSMEVIPFSNLSLLQLKTSFSKHQICATACFLEKCPNLETLILKVTEYPPPKSAAKVKSASVKEGGSWKAESALHGFMHHLKLVQIWDVLATTNELKFLKFLLKNAIVLEKMVVFIAKQQFPENNKRFKFFGNELISYCGASSNTEIVLM